MSEKIKILKCSNPILWYKDHIGKTFTVERNDKNAYWVLEPNELNWRLLNWVYKDDVEVV